jgi:hypothetical protein
VGVRVKGGTRLATAVIGSLVAVGFVAAAAPRKGLHLRASPMQSFSS